MSAKSKKYRNRCRHEKCTLWTWGWSKQIWCVMYVLRCCIALDARL